MDLLTKARLDGIVSSMSLLLHNSGKYRIEVLGLSSQADSNNAVMDFYVVQSDSEVADIEGGPSSKIASGKKAVEQLGRKLKADADLLSLKVCSA